MGSNCIGHGANITSHVDLFSWWVSHHWSRSYAVINHIKPLSSSLRSLGPRYTINSTGECQSVKDRKISFTISFQRHEYLSESFALLFQRQDVGPAMEEDTPMKVISHTGLSKGHLKNVSVWMTLKSRWKDSRTDALDHRYFLHLFNCFLGFNLYHDDNIIISCCQIFLYCYSPSSVSEGTSKPPPTNRRKLGVCDYLSSLFGIGNL